MESLDVVEDICPRFSPGSILSAIYPLPLEHAKEAFRYCIVGTSAYRAHAANQIVSLQEALVFVTGKLTAAIRMQDDRGFRLSLSPLGWEHINLTGDYLWRSSVKIGAGKFRPLRPLTES